MSTIYSNNPNPEQALFNGKRNNTRKRGEPDKAAEEAEKPGILLQLDQRKFQQINPPVKPKTVFSIGDSVICTPGNLMGIAGATKVGKTAVFEAMLAASMKPTASERMLLGLRSCLNDGKAIIHFDTEQSRYDHHMVLSRALKRAGLDRQPENLRSYCLTDVPHQDRMKMLRFELERAENIFVGFIDGVADLMADPNDSEEAFGLVAELHKMAIQYDCPIIGAIHENPGSEFGKTRGHLGSQLERKAETNLRLQKADEITTLWTEKARHCNIPKNNGLRFKYSELHKMHVLCESLGEERMNDAKEEMLPYAVSLFENTHGVLGWKDLRDKIADTDKIRAKSAEKKIKRLVELKIITQDPTNKYVLTP